MVVKQLSVFVENKLGRLTEITSALSENQIDIRALSIADTTSFGILRLIVNDPDRAEKTLREAGFTVSQTEVLAVGIQDVPGGLAKAMKVLSSAEIPVEYMYAFISRDIKSAYVILRVENNKQAAEILAANGLSLLSTEQVYGV
ncbi:MAG: ACT domain-containing protein [Provencibacterium sp.]|nr:ACT domain-containing protein [Provencibacterium sp.]